MGVQLNGVQGKRIRAIQVRTRVSNSPYSKVPLFKSILEKPGFMVHNAW